METKPGDHPRKNGLSGGTPLLSAGWAWEDMPEVLARAALAVNVAGASF